MYGGPPRPRAPTAGAVCWSPRPATMAEDTGFAAHLLAKHRNSAQPESRQLCAVLGAILEVLEAEGLQPTPIAVYAAVMSSLEKVESQSSPEVRKFLLRICV